MRYPPVMKIDLSHQSGDNENGKKSSHPILLVILKHYPYLKMLASIGENFQKKRHSPIL